MRQIARRYRRHLAVGLACVASAASAQAQTLRPDQVAFRALYTRPSASDK